MINCVVVFGGESCEHDISIVTGCQAAASLDECLYNIIPIYIDRNGSWLIGEKLYDVDSYPDNLGKTQKVAFVPGDNRLYTLKHGKLCPGIEIDMAFICLHGGGGEGGAVASVFELSKISYSSAGVMPSSLALDKIVFKNFCKGIGVSVVDGFSVDYDDYMLNLSSIMDSVKSFGLPVIMKPSRQGSSVGVEVCKEDKLIKKCLDSAFLYDDRVLIEKYIDIDKEINIALFDNKGEIVFSQTEEPKYSDEILSFSDKYLKNTNGFEGIKRIMPANIDKVLENKIRDISSLIYKSLKMSGVVRFDFIYSKMGELFVNEVNTIPGSMANYLFKNMTFGELLNKIRLNSVYSFERGKRITKNYDSKFLKSGISFIKK